MAFLNQTNAVGFDQLLNWRQNPGSVNASSAGGRVSNDCLGLFDTPASRREFRFAIAVICALSAAFLPFLAMSDVQVGEVVAFVPVVDGVVFVGELIIATMLFAQAAIFRSRALTLLASGFVFIALLLVPHALTFPGAFGKHDLLHAGINSTGWIMIFRRLAFPLVIIVYAVLKWDESAAETAALKRKIRIAAWVAGAILLAAIVTALSIRADDLLPPMFVNQSQAIYSNLTVFNLLNIVLVAAAMVILLRKQPSMLDVWLFIALSGWLIQSIINLPVHARFTLGWYGLYLIILVSHLLVLIALIEESNRLYARLALSTAARNREQEARLMSIDAVAAAIVHEVGQPLTAVALNAKASLELLDRSEPNIDTAIDSLRATIDASRRSFDVIKSVRATYSKGGGACREFSLNDLALETASLLDRELAAHKVTLDLALTAELPRIRANRVQIQRVLVNLITNAIDSLAATRGRERRIEIRTAAAVGNNVLVEVSDVGAGIPPDLTTRIFEPFFTTKSKGTGLGLSLSRTIVEEHGGRLWASSNDHQGATFHLQMPCMHSRTEESKRAASRKVHA